MGHKMTNPDDKKQPPSKTAAPEWLQQSWNSAKGQGLDQVSTEEIDAEIEAARKARRNAGQEGRG
jgi:hypothetical protein